MKHAGVEALDRLEPLLAQIRLLPKLKETKRGLFYLRGRSLLHFHEDPVGLFADLVWRGEDLRLRVSEPDEQRRLLETIEAVLAETP
jgi:hypothetical protein